MDQVVEAWHHNLVCVVSLHMACHVGDMAVEEAHAFAGHHKIVVAFVEGVECCVSCTCLDGRTGLQQVAGHMALLAYHQGQHQQDHRFSWRRQKQPGHQSVLSTVQPKSQQHNTLRCGRHRRHLAPPRNARSTVASMSQKHSSVHPTLLGSHESERQICR